MAKMLFAPRSAETNQFESLCGGPLKKRATYNGQLKNKQGFEYGRTLVARDDKDPHHGRQLAPAAVRRPADPPRGRRPGRCAGGGSTAGRVARTPCSAARPWTPLASRAHA